MLHSIKRGESKGTRLPWRPNRTRSHSPRSNRCQSRNRVYCMETRRHYTNQSRLGNEVRMTLTSEHQTHLHHIFYALCRERNWSLGFPTSFDYGYLDADNRSVQAQIILGQGKPTILFHPTAFVECQGHLVKGLLHHELCHYILGHEVAHGPDFHELEQAWDYYMLFKAETVNFARTLLRRKARYVLTCHACGVKFERSHIPVGRLSCRGCCEKHSNGEFDDKYNLHIGVVSMSES